MAVLDTSGSISTQTLEEVGAELARMHRDHDIVVVECDVAVRAVYPFAPPLRHARGRGGTDLRPPFAAEVLNPIRPDVVVYFTDGIGPAPALAPGVPVLWCLTARGTRPTPWGGAVRLPDRGFF
jgi:predicted metal-dependent peptidase